MLMEYHLVFIVISIILLLFSLELLFIEKSKQAGIYSILIIAINLIICQINYMGFFGIDLIGATGDGSINITTYPDMYPIFSLFFLIFFLNVALVYYCWYKQTEDLWETKS